MKMKIKSFMRNSDGATAIEYGLIAAGLAVAVIAAVDILTPSIELLFGSIKTTG